MLYLKFMKVTNVPCLVVCYVNVICDCSNAITFSHWKLPSVIKRFVDNVSFFYYFRFKIMQCELGTCLMISVKVEFEYLLTQHS